MACDTEVSISTSTNNLHLQVSVAAAAQMTVSWLSTLRGVISLFQLLGQVDEEHPPELNRYTGTELLPWWPRRHLTTNSQNKRISLHGLRTKTTSTWTTNTFGISWFPASYLPLFCTVGAWENKRTIENMPCYNNHKQEPWYLKYTMVVIITPRTNLLLWVTTFINENIRLIGASD